MSIVHEDFGWILEYIEDQGYEVNEMPLFDTKAGHHPSQLYTKVGQHAKVLYCCKTSDPRIDFVAAFTEVHSNSSFRTDTWVDDRKAFVAFKPRDVEDFTVVPPAPSVASTVQANSTRGCLWGCNDAELCFSINDLRYSRWDHPHMRPKQCYRSLPNVGSFEVSDLAVFAVSGEGDSDTASPSLRRRCVEKKMSQLIHILALNPHFREDELEMLRLMSRHRVMLSLWATEKTQQTDKKQQQSKIRSILKESAVPELMISGSIAAYDLAALTKGTGVSVLNVQSDIHSKSVSVLRIAFSQPEATSLLTVLKVAVTNQSIDGLCQLLQSEPKRLEKLIIANSKTLDVEHFLRVLQVSGSLRCVRIDGRYTAKLEASEFQRLLNVHARHPTLNIDFGGGVNILTSGPVLPPFLTDSKNAPQKSLVLVIGHKKYFPCDIDAAKRYSLLIGNLLESGALPKTVAEREILLELDHPVSTDAAITAVVFLESVITVDDHRAAVDTEVRDLLPYLPAHQLGFANKYIFPLPASRILHFLSELLEVATYLNVPALKRFVRSVIMLLLAKHELDPILRIGTVPANSQRADGIPGPRGSHLRERWD